MKMKKKAFVLVVVFVCCWQAQAQVCTDFTSTMPDITTFIDDVSKFTRKVLILQKCLHYLVHRRRRRWSTTRTHPLYFTTTMILLLTDGKMLTYNVAGPKILHTHTYLDDWSFLLGTGLLQNTTLYRGRWTQCHNLLCPLTFSCVGNRVWVKLALSQE